MAAPQRLFFCHENNIFDCVLIIIVYFLFTSEMNYHAGDVYRYLSSICHFGPLVFVNMNRLIMIPPATDYLHRTIVW